MAIRKPSSSLSILFLLSVGQICAGVGWFYIQWGWNLWNGMLTGLGFLALCVCFFESRRHVRAQTQWFDLRRHFVAFVSVLLLITLYILVNYLGLSYERRWDLTKYKQHTLVDKTIAFIHELKNDVKMTAFYVGIPPKYLEDLLREYERHGAGRITTEIVDPIVQIGYAAQFGQVISGQEKKLIIQSGAERRDVDFTKIPLNEERVNNAMMQVTREARTACFITGHGEYSLFASEPEGLKLFAQDLLANNIVVQSVFLEVAPMIPEACQVLVVAGPKKHFTEQEIEKIQKYMLNGGDVLFLIEHALVATLDNPLTPEQESLNPSLNEILNSWGLGIENDVVVDLASHASGDVGSPATNNYMAHKAIVGGLDYTFYVRPRSIRMLGSKPADVRLAPLVMTSSEKTSWGETNRYLDVQFDPESDRIGPVPIAFVGWRQKNDVNQMPSDTRFIVFTDADFLTNAFVKSYSNAEMGVNALNWLTEKDYQTFLSQSEVEVVRLDLTSRQKRMIIFVLLFLNVAIASGGIFIWLRQKQNASSF